MLFGKYTVRSTLDEDAYLPVFKGSTFRGAFARAFKKTVCAVRQSECSDCLLEDRCLYKKTFEPHKRYNSQATAPQPYLIEPPLSSDTYYPAGSSFDFNLGLFGGATEYLPYYILALEKMGQLGIGKKSQGKGPARFSIFDVQLNGDSVYDSQNKKLHDTAKPDQLVLNSNNKEVEGNITLSLHTPLRVKHKNQLANELPFFVLVKAMLRRISSLFEEYGRGEPDIDYSGLVNKAKDIPSVYSSLYWHEFRRYSNRQDTSMQIGGLVGEVSYSGNLGEYIPLLEISKELHIGKQATFGLGLFDYKLEIN